MFIETWTIPRSFSSKPFARTNRSPPPDSRTAAAIFFAMFTSGVPRFTLKAMSGARAPTTVAPAGGWGSRGPRAGAPVGFCFPLARGPFDPAAPDTGRGPPVGSRGGLLVQVHGHLELA